MELELRHLRVVCAIADAGSVSRAAAALALPGAEITTELGHSTGRLIELVATDVADCAVIGEAPGYEHPAAPGVECHTVVTEPIFALLPEDHPLAETDEVELGALTREPWALPPLSDDRMWEGLRAITSEAGQVPTVAYQADGGLLVDLVRAGEAVALVQPTMAEHPGVVVRPLARNPVRWRQQLAWRRTSPLAADLVRYAEEAYLDAVARSPAYRGWCARHGVDPRRDLLER